MTSFFSMALAPLLRKAFICLIKAKTRSIEAGFAFSRCYSIVCFIALYIFAVCSSALSRDMRSRSAEEP